MKDFKFLRKPLHERIYDIVVEIGDNILDNNDEYMEKIYFRDECKVEYAYMDMDINEEIYVLVIKCIPHDELVTKFLTFHCYMDDTEWVYDGEYEM